MTSIPKPASRLITQNLVVSAGFAEGAIKPDWLSVQDLAVLIDLFCMYDSAVVLGRGDHSALQSPLGSLLETSGFLEVQYPDSNIIDDVSETAKRHLLTYLGERNLGDSFDELLRFAMNANQTIFGLSSVPDRWEDVQQGDMWLKTTPTKDDVLEQLRREMTMARGTTFIVRSFLYLGYSDVTGLVLAPDAARTALVGTVVSAEQQLRGKLLKAIREASSARMTYMDTNLTRVSPLAAVVFERAKPDRKRIIPEMVLLREELAPLRKRVRDAEQGIINGKGDEVTDALKDWKLVADELKRSFGEDPHLVSVENLLAYGRDVGELADSPTKSKAWMGFLLGLPFDVLRRLLLRRQAVQLHRVRHDLPGPGRLLNAVRDLFGPDIDS